MGFMRKALFVYTGGLSGAAGVKANSKKERTAKAMEKQVRLQKQQLKRSDAAATASAASPPATAGQTLARPAGPRGHCDLVLTQVDPARKDAAIEVLHGVTGLSLPTCKRLVDSLPYAVLQLVGEQEADAVKARFGDYGAVAQVRLRTAGNTGVRLGPTAAGYRVTLLHPGDKKIQVIKVVRDVTRLGLKEAKELADHPPSWIATFTTDAAAEALADRLRSAGAQVELTSPPAPKTEIEPSPVVGLPAELERLATLHTSGSLTDSEFAAAKARLLNA